MTDYLPLHDDGDTFTRQASATVAAGQLVRVSGSGTVAPVSTAGTDWLGVAAYDANTGDNVTVYCAGVQRLTAAAAITAGQILEGASGGQVAPSATPDDTTSVGVALTTAASGALVEVKLSR